MDTFVIQNTEAKRYISVILRNDSPKVKKQFHCTYCGRIVFEFFDQLHIIFQGFIEDNDSNKINEHPYEIWCSRCKTVYLVL